MHMACTESHEGPRGSVIWNKCSGCKGALDTDNPGCNEETERRGGVFKPRSIWESKSHLDI